MSIRSGGRRADKIFRENVFRFVDILQLCLKYERNMAAQITLGASSVLKW